MNKILKAVILATIAPVMLLAFIANVPANAAETATHFKNGTVRVETADRKVRHLELAYFAPTREGKASVKFNNGSVWSFAPCKFEDSPNCFWNAGSRGNGLGHSFIRAYGKTFYVNEHGVR